MSGISIDHLRPTRGPHAAHSKVLCVPAQVTLQ